MFFFRRSSTKYNPEYERRLLEISDIIKQIGNYLHILHNIIHYLISFYLKKTRITLNLALKELRKQMQAQGILNSVADPVKFIYPVPT